MLLLKCDTYWTEKSHIKPLNSDQKVTSVSSVSYIKATRGYLKKTINSIESVFLVCGNKNILKREKARHSWNSLTARYMRKGRTGKTESKIKAKLSETLSLTYQDKNSDHRPLGELHLQIARLLSWPGPAEHDRVIIFCPVSFLLSSELCERGEIWGEEGEEGGCQWLQRRELGADRLCGC